MGSGEQKSLLECTVTWNRQKEAVQDNYNMNISSQKCTVSTTKTQTRMMNDDLLRFRNLCDFSILTGRPPSWRLMIKIIMMIILWCLWAWNIPVTVFDKKPQGIPALCHFRIQNDMFIENHKKYFSNVSPLQGAWKIELLL